MHVATLNRISVDRECHIAATASDDKTVRVWSLPEGKLLRTLRGSRRVIVGRAAPNKNGMGARGERRPNRKSSINGDVKVSALVAERLCVSRWSNQAERSSGSSPA
jgi:WD40 repeat protein